MKRKIEDATVKETKRPKHASFDLNEDQQWDACVTRLLLWSKGVRDVPLIARAQFNNNQSGITDYDSFCDEWTDLVTRAADLRAVAEASEQHATARGFVQQRILGLVDRLASQSHISSHLPSMVSTFCAAGGASGDTAGINGSKDGASSGNSSTKGIASGNKGIASSGNSSGNGVANGGSDVSSSAFDGAVIVFQRLVASVNAKTLESLVQQAALFTSVDEKQQEQQQPQQQEQQPQQEQEQQEQEQQQQEQQPQQQQPQPQQQEQSQQPSREQEIDRRQRAIFMQFQPVNERDIVATNDAIALALQKFPQEQLDLLH